MRRRRSSLLLRLWVLSLSTFVVTALVSLLVPDLFFDSPIEEFYARETAAQVEQLDAMLDAPMELTRAATRLHERVGLDIEIWTGEARVVALGDPGATPRRIVLRPATEGRPEVVAAYAMPDPPPPPVDLRHLVTTLALVILGGLVHALLLRRLVTRPLSRLAAAAETFDAGNLDARVGLRGNDEFADVSRAFDDMAGRIEGFVGAQRELLANVSHELRTPLARIRVVLDTVDATGDMTLVAELHEDVDELQGLVETLLEAVSLEAGDERRGLLRGGMAEVDPVELLELAARRFER
ncbi:MAG: HAMP domain-containing protein, partial [Deltaproteobacteria bacterium]|nr:HAMP domain-containing protein [Nannocystaceae bacterium]